LAKYSELISSDFVLDLIDLAGISAAFDSNKHAPGSTDSADSRTRRNSRNNRVRVIVPIITHCGFDLRGVCSI
jgi:hypothetical protein